MAGTGYRGRGGIEEGRERRDGSDRGKGERAGNDERGMTKRME